VDGSLTELKALMPPAEIEYVEKQPTLEEIFLSIVGHDTANDSAPAASARN
jgi:ABC-2 type transport system ATP-binding protein